MSNEKNVEGTPAQGTTILTGKKLFVVFVAMLLSLLLIALDQTILSTALPRIASDFEAFSLQGWVASSFVLAQTVFILFFGQMMRVYPSKWVMVACISLFELGSLICGLSHNVNQLIAGRAISGLGAAGMFVAMIQTLAQVTRLEDRPRLFGAFGAVFGLSSVIGPLIGGAFTDHVTWRWCFFINLPVGGVSILAVSTLLKSAPPLGADLTKRSNRDIWEQTKGMDFIGATLIAGAVTCLMLALQWGGNTKPWGDKSVIICFVFAAVVTAAFVTWEIRLGDRAMVPMGIWKSKSIYAIVVYAFMTRFSLLLFSYYIPIFYQAARHRTATQSGVDLLPFMLGVVGSVITSGQLVAVIGRYWPFLFISPMFLAIGSGLLYTLNANTSGAALIGFQILAGVGTGMGMQNTLLALQVEFQHEPHLISQGTSIGSFAQFLGGTVGLGIAEPVFASLLSKNLKIYAPNAPAKIVEESPATIYTAVPAEMIPGVVQSYTEALKVVYLIGVPVAIIALLLSLLINNLKIVKTKPAGKGMDVEKDVETVGSVTAAGGSSQGEVVGEGMAEAEAEESEEARVENPSRVV